jgi:transposase
VADIRLTARDRAALEQKARHSANAREARRALGLLALAGGEPAAAVARRLLVSRSTVYEWAARRADGARPKPDRLKDAPRAGRPPRQSEAARERLAELMPTAPRERGYRHPAWTTPLLLAHLGKLGVPASDTTVRRALHGPGYRWKRPRFVLSRRRPTWRQAEGGCSGG